MSSSQHRKRGGIGWAPSSAGDFEGLDAAEFVVLLPQIGFDGSAAARNRRIAASPRVRPTRSCCWDVANSRRQWCPAPTASDVPKRNGG